MTRRSPLPALASAFATIAVAATLAALPQPAAAEAPAPKPAAGQSGSTPRNGEVDVAGAAIHYQVYGDLKSGRTPLVVLHGAFMSADAMKPLIDPLAATRPVIAVDARGHGRSGGVDGPLSYDRMADDTAAVLDSLGVRQADVLGYSMGGSTAVALAVKHPDRIGKQVILSATSRLDGWYPEVLAGISKLTPEIFAGSPIDTEYKRLSPAPQKFPVLVANIKSLDATPFGWSDAAVRAIPGRTMVIIGDADGVTLDHAIQLFKLRGGGDVAAATQGFLTSAPKARLAILPATSHIGIMGEVPAIAAMVTPFLDDKAPPPPSF
ncbi:MAG: alpha/beta fold hydrolase [Sphingopyxis sp.]|nr:alpha/beta fold hydrolase [Sphingopyxis sp.]